MLLAHQLESGDEVKVIAPGSPYRGLTGVVRSVSLSGKSVSVKFSEHTDEKTVRLTSLELLGGRRSASQAVVDLADALTRLVRVSSEVIEDRGDIERVTRLVRVAAEFAESTRPRRR